MRAHALNAADVMTAQLGWVVAHDVPARDGGSALRKGTLLDTAALDALASATFGEVHLLEPEAGELHEDTAGLRVAHAVAGDGVNVSGPLQSHYDLIATVRGLLRVDAALVGALNDIDGVTVYTVVDCQPV